jgi:PKHD-type hydroxylase
MFNTIEHVLNASELEELRAIAARAQFIDGRISAPGAPVKNNMVVGDRELFGRSSQIVADALYRSEDFRVFAFPKAMTPPVLTRYGKGMYYGTHTDAAFMPQPSRLLRSDLSCTVFLSDPESYDGGELVSRFGSAEVRLRAPAGAAIVYPSTTLHRVEEVTRGERLVALTFIESRIADGEQRELLFELNEIAAIAGEKMDIDTFTRFQRVQQNLLRKWGDPD